MKKTYITPECLCYKTEASMSLLAGSVDPIKTSNQTVMQYDGDQLHSDLTGGTIAGPASEYVGTNNENNPVNESSIFDD